MMPTKLAKAGAVGIFMSAAHFVQAETRPARSTTWNQLASLLEVSVGTSPQNGTLWSSSVTGLVSEDLEDFLRLLPPHQVLLQITYPAAPGIAREQQEHLARVLCTQGLKRSALLIESAAQDLVFSEPREAWDTYCCLRYASLAIEVSIYRVSVYLDMLSARRSLAAKAQHPAIRRLLPMLNDDTRSLV